MPVNPTQVFEAFDAAVKEVVAPIQVFVAQVPEDANLPIQGGKLLPYVATYSGGPIRAAGGHHIVGSRNDVTVLFWTVQVWAPTIQIARFYKGKITELAGRVLVDSSELVLAGGNTFTRSSNEVRPTQYVEEVQFTTRSNMQSEW